MKCTATSVLLFAALFAGAAADAQDSAATAQAQPQDALQPLEFLIGTWRANGANPAIGKFTTTRAYRWALGGRYLEMREEIRGEKQNIGAWAFIGIDPANGKLTVWAFASDGSQTTITQTGEAAPGELRIEGSFTGADAAPVRATIKKESAGFTEIGEIQRAGKWTPSTLKFVPAPNASPLLVNTVQAPPADSPLSPLGQFSGTWLIEGENEGRKFTVEYAFAWVLGGRFMTTTYSIGMGGAPQLHAISIIGYEPQAKEIVQRGFNAEGSVLRAKVSVTGGTLEWEGRMAGARTQGLRSTYRLKDADTLEFTTEMKRGDRLGIPGRRTDATQKGTVTPASMRQGTG